ncbi:MAG: metallophosphoesterase [Patescibacteria group bacterium]
MRYLFDFLIFFILFSCCWWFRIIYLSIKKQPEIKTKKARFFLLAVIILIFVVVIYGSFVEPQLIKTTKIPITLSPSQNKATIKIAFLTDWHLGYFKGPFFANRIVNLVKNEKPDLILLGGDFLDRKRKPEDTIFPLQKISLLIPTFAVMGNHEYNTGGINDEDFEDRTKELRQFFFKNKIKVLDNGCETISLKNKKINIAGIIDLWTGKADLRKAYETCDPRQKTVLLAHNPDVILSPPAEKFDLILSGHTHNGQVRLPFIGSIYPIPTELGRKFGQGLFQLKNNQLYISSGIGEGGTRARLFNRPELTIIELTY